MDSKLFKLGAAFTAVCALVLLSSLFLTGFLGRERVEDVILEVDYFENWNLNISEDGYSWSFSELGRTEKCIARVDDDEWVITVDARKVDGSSGRLTVRIKLRDGTVLKEASTSEPYGAVSFTIEIK